MRKSAPALRFRAFELADVGFLGPWLRAAGLGVPSGIEAGDWGRRLLEDPRIICRVASGEGGSPLGFFRLDFAPDRTAEVTVIVDPEERRRGIGGRLLEEALVEARRAGLRRLLAVTEEGNRAGQEFFLTLGFEVAATSMPGFIQLARVVHGAGRQPPLEIVP